MAIHSWVRYLPLFFLSLPARRPRRVPARRTRLRLEPLEERALLTTISWINPLGGDWDNPLNWLGGNVPGPSDKAVINLPGSFTVTHNLSVADSVRSLVCTQTFDLCGGSLSVAKASTITTFDLTGGTLYGPGKVTVLGLFTWTAGTLNDSGQIDANGGLNINGSGPLTLAATTLNNGGTAMWTAGDINTLGGSTFNNLAGATFKVYGNAAFHPTFNNFGTFIQAGSGTTTFDTLNNSGTFKLMSGSLNLGNFSQDAGVTDLGGITLNATDVTWTGGRIKNGGQLNATGSLLLDGTGPMSLDNSTINNFGTATWTAGDINSLGGGIFNNITGATFTASSDAAFHTTFNNAGSFTLAGSAITTIDTLNNSGTVTLSSGELDTTYFNQNAGLTSLGGNTLESIFPVQINGGGLLGSGTIDGDLVNGGLINPGGLGVLTVNGDYTQRANGQLWIGIGGMGASQIDQLSITGNAVFQGTLKVRFINGFTPGPQDSYLPISADAISGTFGAVTIANPSTTVKLRVVYFPTGVEIAAGPWQPPTSGITGTTGLGSGSSSLPPQPGFIDASGLSGLASSVPVPRPLADAVFVIPGSLTQHLSEETIRALALARVGAAAPTTAENALPETSPKSDAGSLAADLRRGVGSAGMVESGADDDLVQALLASISNFDRAIGNEVLSGSDIATSLLTGVAPKADILPHKGSRVAAVVTLLAGEDGDERVAQPDGGGDELPLKDFLINPVHGRIDSPAPKKTNANERHGEEGAKVEPARGQLGLPVAVGLGAAPLVLGAARSTKRLAARRPIRASRRKRRGKRRKAM